jgi:hypothetical protein
MLPIFVNQPKSFLAHALQMLYRFYHTFIPCKQDVKTHVINKAGMYQNCKHI